MNCRHGPKFCSHSYTHRRLVASSLGVSFSEIKYFLLLTCDSHGSHGTPFTIRKPWEPPDEKRKSLIIENGYKENCIISSSLIIKFIYPSIYLYLKTSASHPTVLQLPYNENDYTRTIGQKFPISKRKKTPPADNSISLPRGSLHEQGFRYGITDKHLMQHNAHNQEISKEVGW